MHTCYILVCSRYTYGKITGVLDYAKLNTQWKSVGGMQVQLQALSVLALGE
jgi:hypothetical protein